VRGRLLFPTGSTALINVASPEDLTASEQTFPIYVVVEIDATITYGDHTEHIETSPDLLTTLAVLEGKGDPDVTIAWGNTPEETVEAVKHFIDTLPVRRPKEALKKP
jgi:hypothetical protein